MRSFHRFLAVDLGIALLSIPGSGKAFWTSGWFNCGAVKPVDDHRGIRVELARVVIRARCQLVTFDSEFRLFNPGRTVTMRVEHPDVGHRGDEDILGFTAWVNGKRAEVTKQECDNDLNKTLPDGTMILYFSPPIINCGFTHKVTFVGHSVTTIRTRHSSVGSRYYLLGPAANWKGPVGRTVIIVGAELAGGMESVDRSQPPVLGEWILGDNFLKYEFGRLNQGLTASCTSTRKSRLCIWVGIRLGT